MTGKRFPYSALLDHMPPGFNARQQAERLGICSRTVWRLHHTGLDEWKADRFATRLGLHPSLVWSNWWSSVEIDETEFEIDPVVVSLDAWRTHQRPLYPAAA